MAQKKQTPDKYFTLKITCNKERIKFKSEEVFFSESKLLIRVKEVYKMFGKDSHCYKDNLHEGRSLKVEIQTIKNT